MERFPTGVKIILDKHLKKYKRRKTKFKNIGAARMVKKKNKMDHGYILETTVIGQKMDTKGDLVFCQNNTKKKNTDRRK